VCLHIHLQHVLHQHPFTCCLRWPPQNADPDVRTDMETWMNKVVPEVRGSRSPAPGVSNTSSHQSFLLTHPALALVQLSGPGLAQGSM
jgi:thiamine phosphate synthase YjbQ (UPF0047 family)